MSFINLGTRNKAIFWEYIPAYSFLHTSIVGTRFRLPSLLSVGEGIATGVFKEGDFMEVDANAGIAKKVG